MACLLWVLDTNDWEIKTTLYFYLFCLLEIDVILRDSFIMRTRPFRINFNKAITWMINISNQSLSVEDMKLSNLTVPAQ